MVAFLFFDFHSCYLSNMVGYLNISVKTVVFIILLKWHLTLETHWQSFFSPDGRHKHGYIHRRDINLGAVFSIHEPDNTLGKCGSRLRDTGSVQYVEAMVYAIEQINRDKNLLGNLELGHIILDDCAKTNLALGQALHFMPLFPEQQYKESCEECYDKHPLKGSFFNVWGVLGAENTPSTIKISEVLNHFNIPVISPFATGDILSDKSKFPFFFRMVPPDKYQVTAIVALLQHFNWTYISILHSKGEYGEGANQMLKDIASGGDICVASSILVTPDLQTHDYSNIVRKLSRLQSRVVVLFIDQEEMRFIFKAVQRLDLVGYFLWVGSDGLGINIDDLDGVEEVAEGSLSLATYGALDQDFFNYFEKLTPFTHDNPWISDLWCILFNCSWESNGPKPSCSKYDNVTQAEDYTPEATVSAIIDTVYIFAKALHNFINAKCPEAFSNTSQLIHCVNDQSKYYDFLKNVSLQGSTGMIQFDDQGDIMGRYQVLNYHLNHQGNYVADAVGFWDTRSFNLNLSEWKVRWNSHSKGGAGVRPESSCGIPCSPGHVYSYHRDTCCWDCRRCEPNEKVINDQHQCEDCPYFTWPDSVNYTECVALIPTVTLWSHPVIVFFLSSASLGLIVCLLILIAFVLHNDHRLIKATSRELSYIMMGGVTLQFILPLSIVAVPHDLICYCNYIGFNTGFTILYAPLLTRTIRIYRIFRSGRRSLRKPSMISPGSQVFITLCIIFVQVVMNISTVMMTPPVVELRMPKETEPLVEETCTFPFRGFIASLCYNLLLIVVCSFYAFKSRHLPDNFNESRYIALCVYTTLVIWTVFLPSYFVNNRAFHQMVLLSSATLLNGTVTLLCLYIPKVYATYKNEEAGGSSAGSKFSYMTPSANQHEMGKCSRGRSTTNGTTGGGTAVSILHTSNSKPSLDGSTKRQSFSDSDEGLEPLKSNEQSSSIA